MSFITDAAKYYAAQPHQDAAWEYLWASVDEYTQDCFMDAYRDGPEAPEGIITLEVFEQLTGYSASLFKQSEADDCNRLLRETEFDTCIVSILVNILLITCDCVSVSHILMILFILLPRSCAI